MSRDLAHRPHTFDPSHSGGSTCLCWRARAYRMHQPWWWRLIHPLAIWR